MLIQKRRTSLVISAVMVSLMGCGQNSTDTKTTLVEPASIEKQSKIQFKDVTQSVGLVTENNWKYGGPAVVDMNNDGRYDFLLTNHNTTPAQLFIANDDNTYTEIKDQFPLADLHGLTAGDYDLDGDNDVILSVGGGSGLKPQPQRLYRNDNGNFVEVTKEAGVSELGARGRAVRWIDLDSDGDLDFLQINAPKVVNEDMPRNILFKNKGDGTFDYQHSPSFEEVDAERLLLSDFDNDGYLDVIAFDGHGILTLLKNNNDFSFTDVTSKWLAKDAENYKYVIAAAHFDMDQDGDLDYYLARGKLHYGLADNSISYTKETKRLDLRDEGNESEDGMLLTVEGDLSLIDFSHWPRAKDLEYMPVFLGKNKTSIKPPENTFVVAKETAKGFPDDMTKTGWYVGYLGDGKWKIRWKLGVKQAWGIRASFGGVTEYDTEFTPNNSNLPDVLLRNDGTHFTDISDTLPKLTHHNNWGVAVGDFDNDSDDDLFVYRFGKLKERIPDLLLVNDGSGKFEASLATSATAGVGKDQHGDMGIAIDYNQDGKLDLLNGDDDNGPWYMYQNITDNDNHYAFVHVGYSAKGVDPYGAKIEVTTKQSKQHKTVGSLNASHSQSLLNIAHFGLAGIDKIDKVKVTWRDGTTEIKSHLNADNTYKFGK